MASQNVNIGIDLGTTNSAVAVNIRGDISVVKNSSGSERTPSVFAVTSSGQKCVGQKAYEQCFRDASEVSISNSKLEIKRLMGTKEEVHFGSANISLSPEEISAEILKSLNLFVDILDQNAKDLSGGEKQRIALAAVVPLGRPLLLLDEPTSALDAESRLRVYECMSSLGNSTVIMVSHNYAEAVSLADRVVRIGFTNGGVHHGSD